VLDGLEILVQTVVQLKKLILIKSALKKAVFLKFPLDERRIIK